MSLEAIQTWDFALMVAWICLIVLWAVNVWPDGKQACARCGEAHDGEHCPPRKPPK